MELLREAAGMVPGLEKMAFPAWLVLPFLGGGCLVLVVVFPCCHVLELSGWSRHLVNIWCSSADSVMHRRVVRGVPNTTGNIRKVSDFSNFVVRNNFVISCLFFGRISCIHCLMLYDL